MNKTFCRGKACKQFARAHGLCPKHLARWKKTGDTERTMWDVKGRGSISRGYRMLSIDSRPISEHRYVMEQQLGRRLLTTEHVHHINHDRLDNRLENLELLSSRTHHNQHVKNFRDEKTKQCCACKQIKPRAQFDRVQNPRRDPSDNKCRICKNTYLRAWRAQRKLNSP